MVAPGPDAELVGAVRASLAAAGDPHRAAQQQRYMRSALPFHGLAMAEVRRTTRRCVEQHRPADRASWETTIRALWDGAGHREDRYAALTIARMPWARAWRDPAALDLAEHLVVTGAWWDLVDETAQHLVGDVLRRHRAEVTARVRGYAGAADVWLRRTAVICQLQHGADTDLDLLRHAIERNVDDESFWLRKSVGWALRQHARTDPGWVRAEVARLDDRLSPLSRREATKHL
jgi:3-methyladenine DNA glycosylase AlkD